MDLSKAALQTRKQSLSRTGEKMAATAIGRLVFFRRVASDGRPWRPCTQVGCWGRAQTCYHLFQFGLLHDHGVDPLKPCSEIFRSSREDTESLQHWWVRIFSNLWWIHTRLHRSTGGRSLWGAPSNLTAMTPRTRLHFILICFIKYI